MVIIKVIDGALYQWETGRAISIKPGPKHTVDEVHYMNPHGDTAYVVEPVTKDGEVIAPIPNILLQEAIDIRAFAVMHTETGDKVVADGTFGVNARQRPSDYVYTEIEFRTYEALADRIEALEKNRMPADTVLFVPQSLNPDQQEQARENIGAASNDEIPSALPNPEKLTFEGAVSATYDGSSPVVVNIPKAGSGVHVGSEPPADPSVNVWIDPEGGDGDLDLTIPDALPNPEKLTFTGIQAEYDGSVPVSVMIPTKTSDLKNDSGYVTSVPDALPNPHKLTFTGAVTGEYDGSQAVTVALPEVMTVELTESNGTYAANKTQQEILAAYEAGQEVRCIEGSMVLPLVQCHVGFCAFACVYNTKLYSVLIKATDNSVTLTVTDASAGGSVDLSGYIPAPETAAVGQTVAVKAVDETGKPTEWEAVNLPEAGESGSTEIRYINTLTLEEDVQWVYFDKDSEGNPFELKELAINVYSVGAEGNVSEGYFKIVPNHNTYVSGRQLADIPSGIRLKGSTRSMAIKIYVDGVLAHSVYASADNTNSFDDNMRLYAKKLGAEVEYCSSMYGLSSITSLMFGSDTSSVLLGKGTKIAVWGR